ncbi:unnamed protein product [Clonostachys rosea]|uniref:Rhodopsin domain-containing protein n=1 Tax=Bionectria ochroleuca TaxID=29856 RepID=A0ABY6UZB3_BIOOC|nr:unnamed protein product [Clonostachys rosea]
MSAMEPRDAASDAAAAAAIEAFRQLTIEIWTLYAVGVMSTVLRTYARIRAVGIRNLRADDYLMWLAIVRYSVGHAANGLANNSMTDAERMALSSSDPEFQQRYIPKTERITLVLELANIDVRVLGSKIQVAGWTIYSTLITVLKLSMLAFYIRLMDGLGRSYQIRIWVGFGIVISSYLAVMISIFAGCRPFNRYWQIYPDPGNVCQAAVSRPIIWSGFAANVVSDIYLICIPLPMLWSSTLRMVKKIASTIVLSAGIFVLVCATLKSVFVLVGLKDPVNGPQLAGSWGIREAFTAVMTTNLPMIFPLFKTWLRPWFASALRSSEKAYNYRTPNGFQTIGGGGGPSGGKSFSRNNRSGPVSETHITANMTFNGSEEQIMDDVKMQSFKVTTSPVSDSDGQPKSGITISNQVEITTEERGAQHQNPARVHETW